MKLVRKDFLIKLERATTVVPKTTTLPVLSHLLLSSVDGNNITLKATDLNISYIGTVPVKDEGVPAAQFTLPAHKLRSIVKELLGDEFEMVYKDKFVTIKAGKSNFKLPAGPAEDYPEINPDDSRNYLTTCKLSVIKSLVSKTAFAASDNGQRLDMVRLVFKDNMLRCTAVDGYRIADYTAAVDDSFSDAEEMILSSDSMAVIKTLTGNPDSPVAIYKQNNTVSFNLDDEKILVRMREDNYPDADSYIDSVKKDKEALLPTSDTIKALKRTALLSDETSTVKLNFTAGQLEIYSESQYGNASDNVEIDYSGDEHTVSFNARYLIEFLQTVSDDHVRFYMPLEAKEAHMLTIGADDSHKYVVMPISIEEG